MLNFKMKLSKAMVSMVLLTAACLPFTVASAAAATGEWWEMTTKMDMPGMSATPQATPAMDPRIAEQTTEMRKKMAEMMKKMTPEQRVQAEAQMAMMEQSMAGGRMGGVGNSAAGMGGQTRRVCMVNGQHYDSKMASNKDCAISDEKKSGNTATYKMKCTGAEPMTGSVERTTTTNSFVEKIKIKTASGETLMISNGKRVGGACDAAGEVAKTKGSVKQGKAVFEEQCDHAVKGGYQTGLFFDDTADQPAQCQHRRADFCKAVSQNLSTLEGYESLINKTMLDMSGSKLDPVKACKLDSAAALNGHCKNILVNGNGGFAHQYCRKDAQMCARLSAALKTESGYKSFLKVKWSSDNYEASIRESNELVASCGVSLASAKATLCKNNIAKKDWVFVGNTCNDQPEVIALQANHCCQRATASQKNSNLNRVDPKHNDMCEEFSGYAWPTSTVTGSGSCSKY